MRIPHDLRLAATFVALLMISSNAGAQVSQRSLNPASQSSEHKEVTGILTDRLTKSKLRAWEAILRIVLAKDKDGRPVHPKLFALYKKADTSGHAIFVELSTQSFAFSSLGWCRVVSQDESTRNATLVLRLNLGMIGRARVSEKNRRTDGFIPFTGLRKNERYAEVLGHELTHAVRLLLDADYLALYRERKAKVYSSSPDSRSIDSLTSLIEKPAEATEEEIWHELIAGREPRM